PATSPPPAAAARAPPTPPRSTPATPRSANAPIPGCAPRLAGRPASGPATVLLTATNRPRSDTGPGRPTPPAVAPAPRHSCPRPANPAPPSFPRAGPPPAPPQSPTT